jgi:hypothetical protein
MPSDLDNFVQELIRELNLQAQDMSAQGDRAGAAVLVRVSNALNSLAERRAAAQLADQE